MTEETLYQGEALDAALAPHVAALDALLDAVDPSAPDALKQLCAVLNATDDMPTWAGFEAFQRVRDRFEALETERVSARQTRMTNVL
jgi:hypothetical protein